MVNQLAGAVFALIGPVLARKCASAVAEAERVADLVDRGAEDVGLSQGADLLPRVAVVEFDVAGVIMGQADSRPGLWRSGRPATSGRGR